jgi:hypothetical protein
MLFVRGIAINLAFTYVAVFFLLAAFPTTDGKAIPSQAPHLLDGRSVDREAGAFSTKTRLKARHEFQYPSTEVLPVGGKSIFKRDNCVSSGSGNDTYQCSSETPTLAECISKIRAHGQVGSKLSVFYTSLGGAQGLLKCKQYFECNPQIGPVALFDNIVDSNWFQAQSRAIAQANPDPMALKPFIRRISRAFAEVSAGDAYLCTPENYCPNNDFDQDKVWGGWEYPALTRNVRVTRIIRVDPSTSVTSQIWTSGDPPTPNAPRG